MGVVMEAEVVGASAGELRVSLVPLGWSKADYLIQSSSKLSRCRKLERVPLPLEGAGREELTTGARNQVDDEGVEKAKVDILDVAHKLHTGSGTGDLELP